MHDYEIYGYSLFETLAGRQGRFWCLEEHWKRISNGAKFLGLGEVLWPDFLSAVRESHDPNRNEVLRVTLLRSGGRWSGKPAEPVLRVLKAPLPSKAPREIGLWIADFPLARCDRMRGFKTGSRLLHQWLLSRARSEGFDNCLLSDQEDFVLETAHHNLFFLRKGRWLTPPLSLGLLPGITRGWLLALGLTEEAPIRLQDLPSVEAVVAGNSVVGLTPVNRIGTREYPLQQARELILRAGSRHYQALPSTEG